MADVQRKVGGRSPPTLRGRGTPDTVQNGPKLTIKIPDSQPKTCISYSKSRVYRESLPMGPTKVCEGDLHFKLQAMSLVWKAEDYRAVVFNSGGRPANKGGSRGCQGPPGTFDMTILPVRFGLFSPCSTVRISV